MEDIDREARKIIAGYPLAASLAPAGDVGQLLPAPHKAADTYGLTDAAAALDEPVFEQYGPEIAAMLGSREEDASWRADQVELVAQAVRQSTDTTPARFLPPPFSVPALTGTSSNGLVSDLTRAINAPVPHYDSASGPLSRPFVTPAQAAEHLEHEVRQRTAAPPPVSSPAGKVPPSSSFTEHRDTVAPMSSPDPLGMTSPALQGQQRVKGVVANGKYYTEQASSLSPPSLSKKRSSYFGDGGSPLKRRYSPSTSEADGSAGFDSYSSPYLPTQERRLTESQRAAAARRTNGAGKEGGKAGVESAVRKFTIGADERSMSKMGTAAEVLDSLSTLISDILSIENSLVGDTSNAQLAPADSSRNVDRHFRTDRSTGIDGDSGQLLLKRDTIKKLLKQFAFVRLKQKGEEMLEEVGEGGLAGILRLVERSWKATEDLALWDDDATRIRAETVPYSKGAKNGSKSKKRRASTTAADEEDEDFKPQAPTGSQSQHSRRSSRSRSRSVSPAVNVADGPDRNTDNDEEYLSDSRLAAFQEGLDDLEDAALAMRTALTILSTTRLPKQLYSMDYITGIVTRLRQALDSVVWPLVEATPNTPLLTIAQSRSRDIAALLSSLEGAFADLAMLLRQEPMPEDFVISSTYFALSPFLHDHVPAGSARGSKQDNVVGNAIKSVRITSLGLIRTLVSQYPDQRLWIVEEVLNYASKLEIARKVKGSVRLRNGATIHTISALLLQLVQSAPPDTSEQMRRRVNVNVNGTDSPKPIVNDGFAMEVAEEGASTLGTSQAFLAARDILSPVIEGSTKAAHAIFRTLLQKSCRLTAKSVAGSAEADYKIVLDNLVSDLLSALNLPEWPGAETMLAAAARLMIAALSDSQNSVESNSLKLLAIEHVGAIAARLRRAAAKLASPHLRSLMDIMRESDVAALDELVKAQRDLIVECKKIERTNGEDKTASEYLTTIYGDELANAERAVGNALAGNDTIVSDQARDFHDRLVHHCQTFWEFEEQDDVFGWSNTGQASSADEMATRLAQVQPLARLYESLLERIIDGLDSGSVTLRTKALKAISLVVAEDDSLFNRLDVRKSLQNRMLDNSPSVRDATLELTGKYVVLKPDVAADYLSTILDRLTDTSLAVRRRAIKLSKVLYGILPTSSQRVAVCRKLVWRIIDEDENIKDLVLDSIEELWFAKSGRQVDDAATAVMTEVMVKTIGRPAERSPPVEEALKMILARAVEKGKAVHLDNLRLIVNGLTQGLLEDNSPFTLAECVKSIYTLHLADPTLLEPSKASILLPFLRNASNREEQIVSEYLVKIFRSMVVHLPKTSLKFARDLQDTLVTMINRPTSSPGSTALQDIVSCFCAVVKSQTKDYDRLIAVFKACFGRLGAEVRKTTSEESIEQINKRTLPMLAFLSAVIAENANFDELRLLVPEVASAINGLTTKSIHEQVYHMVVRLYEAVTETGVRAGLLASLNCLFRAFPQLMVTDATSRIFRQIFDEGAISQQTQILRIVHDFLSSQERAAAPLARKDVKKEKGVKFEELVGTVEGFADSGVPSAVCHIYMNQIVSAATSTDPALRQVAAEILFMISRSGFGHPLELAPSIVALTAGADGQTASKAYSTLATMLQKHASLLASRFLQYFQAAFDFTTRLGSDTTRGWTDAPPTSRLGRWYGLLQKEKRQHQLDFLKAAGRVFEIEIGGECANETVAFVRWMAEALSTLPYKRNEEVLYVINAVNKCLAVAGIQIMHLLHGDSLAAEINGVADSGTEEATDERVVRQSVICGLSLLLRDHLKKLYSISDAQLAKYVPGKKSSFGDKAAVRNESAVGALGEDGYPCMPLALSTLDTPELLAQQKQTYIRLVNEDGTLHALNELEYEEE